MKLGKIIGGIVTVACAPLVVLATAEVAATVGAIAVVYGGLSESVAIASGVTAMKVADKTTIAAGTKMIAEALE